MDDAGDSVRVGPAGRIVSLNPVATELLFASGAGPRVVGRTHWDTYPAEAASAPDLGNGIEPNVEAVVGAKPDLVVLYLSASNRKAAAALHQAGIMTAVAPLGTALTEDQMKVLWRHSPNPILCFDGDAAGQRAAYPSRDGCDGENGIAAPSTKRCSPPPVTPCSRTRRPRTVST